MHASAFELGFAELVCVDEVNLLPHYPMRRCRLVDFLSGPEEYNRRQVGGMLKTVLIVVGSAVTYLGLIITLTAFCSMRMLRTRQKRSRKGKNLNTCPLHIYTHTYTHI